MSKISFNNKQSPFFTAVKEKVNDYFADNNIQRSGERKLYIKCAIQITAALAIYVVLVFFNPGVIASLLLCVLLGINLSVIGFNVMHEGGHQSLSKHTWINTMGAYLLNMMGGNSYFWKIKHNINHHTYTNIEGMDSDIDIKPFMRLHETQSHFWIHKFQHFYCLILYGISYFSWIFWDDFQKYFTGKIAEGSEKGLEVKEHFIFWITKALYIVAYIGVPMFMLGIVNAIIGFAIVSFVCGLSIAIVFQLAHVVEGTTFPEVTGDSHKIEQEWAIHQVCTTANFSTRSKIISWLLGGLNFQVEHHLFPRVSHIHYPKINEFVKETCQLYEVTYLEYSTMFKAIGSHFNHIKRMGKVV
jgi:linoleoyl-CoA desaturase